MSFWFILGGLIASILVVMFVRGFWAKMFGLMGCFFFLILLPAGRPTMNVKHTPPIGLDGKPTPIRD